jgi:hypothetical protein
MSLPICAEDCTSILAGMAFDECAPIWNRGEISTVYLFNIGQPVIANPRTDPAGFIAEMALRVSNTSANVDAIRKLTVIGEKAEPEKTAIKMSMDREIVTSKKHSIVFEIDETSQENRDAQRQMECGNKFLIMYEVGDWIYGGADGINNGIECSITADIITPKDRTALELIKCTAVWNNKFSPESCLNPLV